MAEASDGPKCRPDRHRTGAETYAATSAAEAGIIGFLFMAQDSLPDFFRIPSFFGSAGVSAS